MNCYELLEFSGSYLDLLRIRAQPVERTVYDCKDAALVQSLDCPQVVGFHGGMVPEKPGEPVRLPPGLLAGPTEPSGAGAGGIAP